MVHADTTALLDVVVLGGGGHVGLPLSLALADAGLRVGVFDTNDATLEQIGRGKMPFLEIGADELLPKVLATGRLELGSSAEMIERAETVMLVIGTPVDEFLGPSMRVFERAVAQIAPHVRDGALVVLRSTVYPGTTAHVAAAHNAGIPVQCAAAATAPAARQAGIDHRFRADARVGSTARPTHRGSAPSHSKRSRTIP